MIKIKGFQKRFERSTYSSNKRRANSSSGRRVSMPEVDKGNEFKVMIEKENKKGIGMVYLYGFTIYIKNAIKGERLKIKITKVTGKSAEAIRLYELEGNVQVDNMPNSAV